MLSESTRKRIKQRKIYKHSNPSQLLKRVREQSSKAIKDLTLIAKNLEEGQLQEIFTSEKLAPLMEAILQPKSGRTLYINEMLAGRVFNKLALELPLTIVNELGSDLGKTWTYAKIASEFWDKSQKGKK
ncbi:MAG: hypothetical protein IIA83_12165 [Thaumarchaeota archaeon]|nr:hypothetical protein [Nitrososphaerota archaeon]